MLIALSTGCDSSVLHCIIWPSVHSKYWHLSAASTGHLIASKCNEDFFSLVLRLSLISWPEQHMYSPARTFRSTSDMQNHYSKKLTVSLYPAFIYLLIMIYLPGMYWFFFYLRLTKSRCPFSKGFSTSFTSAPFSVSIRGAYTMLGQGTMFACTWVLVQALVIGDFLDRFMSVHNRMNAETSDHEVIMIVSV